ncbi:hypothetical protein [Comamonas sp.]|uniref:hypothetical protein n=1 Tax=Comamonas sp. TaxID=34028 RepID=UPI0025851BBF|nr:hypothetical protein [Comamonas sp.]
MSGNNIPANPKTRFGWPLVHRREEFRKKSEAGTTATHRVVLQGQTRDLPITRIHQNVPRYRLENGRTASAQVEYLAKNPSAREDLFIGDPEMLDAQETQHTLLLSLANKSHLRRFFEYPPNKQVDPILLDHDGFVVNGNRRLSTWRDLYLEDKAKYGHFEYIDVVVLPQVDSKAIDRLEAELQIEKDIKADYTWDAEANMMLSRREREGYSDKDLAELYGKKESQVTELIDMRNYAAEFLKSRGKENMWSTVSGAELAFRRIVTTRQKVGSTGRQELFKEAAFALIDKPEEVNDSLHDAINGMANNIVPIVEKLRAAFDVIPPAVDADTENLFGSAPAKGDLVELALTKEISKPENAPKAREIIVDFIESQKLLKRENKTVNKLLDCCGKANSALQEAINIGLGPDTKIDGVEAQLAIIESQVQKIRAFLKV